MADYRSMFSSAWIRAVDLDGDDQVYVIEKVEPGEVGEEGKLQPIITFSGLKKRLGCNRTNAETLAILYGNDTRTWKGKAVTLYPTTTNYKGDTVDCIRIRPSIPGKLGAQRALPPKKTASKRGVR